MVLHRVGDSNLWVHSGILTISMGLSYRYVLERRVRQSPPGMLSRPQLSLVHGVRRCREPLESLVATCWCAPTAICPCPLFVRGSSEDCGGYAPVSGEASEWIVRGGGIVSVQGVTCVLFFEEV